MASFSVFTGLASFFGFSAASGVVDDHAANPNPKTESTPDSPDSHFSDLSSDNSFSSDSSDDNASSKYSDNKDFVPNNGLRGRDAASAERGVDGQGGLFGKSDSANGKDDQTTQKSTFRSTTTTSSDANGLYVPSYLTGKRFSLEALLAEKIIWDKPPSPTPAYHKPLPRQHILWHTCKDRMLEVREKTRYERLLELRQSDGWGTRKGVDYAGFEAWIAAYEAKHGLSKPVRDETSQADAMVCSSDTSVVNFDAKEGTGYSRGDTEDKEISMAGDSPNLDDASAVSSDAADMASSTSEQVLSPESETDVRNFENVDEATTDSELSDTSDGYDSDSMSIVDSVVSMTSVESAEKPEVHVPGVETDTGVTVAVNSPKSIVEEEIVASVDSSAANYDSAPASKSFAEVLAEWREERQREREKWKVENAILMDDINTGTSAWYDDLEDSEEEETSIGTPAAHPVKGFRDEIAELSRELDAMRPKERADWGPRRDAFMPLGIKPQSNSQSRNISKDLQTAEEVAVVSEITMEASEEESLAGYGQLSVEAFARPARMKRGCGRREL